MTFKRTTAKTNCFRFTCIVLAALTLLTFNGTNLAHAQQTDETLNQKPVSYTHLTLPTTPYV